MAKKEDLSFISTITDEQARRVLALFLQENPKFIPKAAAIANDLLSGIDEEEVSERICDSLTNLDVEQLWQESGKTRHGYVDPYDHSYEKMVDKIESYLQEMMRYLDRNMVDDARIYCRGIIKGICVYMFEEAGEFADWSLDNEDGLTYDVIRRWKTKNNNQDIIAELESWRNDCLKMKSR